jgi:hypothetical protein
MLPFLSLHALAAPRGDGLRPELRALLERFTEASDVAITDDRHLTDVTNLVSDVVSGQETLAKRDPKP